MLTLVLLHLASGNTPWLRTFLWFAAQAFPWPCLVCLKGLCYTDMRPEL